MLKTSVFTRRHVLLMFVSLVIEHSIVPVSTECQHLFPAKVVSRLSRWTMMSHQDFLVRLFVYRDFSCCHSTLRIVLLTRLQNQCTVVQRELTFVIKYNTSHTFNFIFRINTCIHGGQDILCLCVCV